MRLGVHVLEHPQRIGIGHAANRLAQSLSEGIRLGIDRSDEGVIDGADLLHVPAQAIERIERCPVVEFGLVGQTMHMVDERVAIADLETLTQIYGTFLSRWFDDAAVS